MNLRQALVSERSRQVTARIVAQITTQRRFDELLELMCGEDRLLSQRAAPAFSSAAQQHPSFLSPHYPRLIAALENETDHPAVPRNIFRAFQSAPVPEPHQAPLFDLSVSCFTSGSQPPASRAFAMSTATHIALDHPDLRRELQLLLTELQNKPGSPAILSRARRCLKILARF